MWSKCYRLSHRRMFAVSSKTPRQRHSFLGKFQTIPNNLANIPTHGPNIHLFAWIFMGLYLFVLGHKRQNTLLDASLWKCILPISHSILVQIGSYRAQKIGKILGYKQVPTALHNKLPHSRYKWKSAFSVDFLHFLNCSKFWKYSSRSSLVSKWCTKSQKNYIYHCSWENGQNSVGKPWFGSYLTQILEYLALFGSLTAFLVPEHSHALFVQMCSVLSEWWAIQYCTLPYWASLGMKEDHVIKCIILSYFPC
jgi:hypothetical protein